MRVVAKTMGFYNGFRRREGEEFEVKDGVKASWFVAIGEPAAHKAVAKAKAKKDQTTEPTALSAVGAGKPQSFIEAMAKKDDGDLA